MVCELVKSQQLQMHHNSPKRSMPDVVKQFATPNLCQIDNFTARPNVVASMNRNFI